MSSRRSIIMVAAIALTAAVSAPSAAQSPFDVNPMADAELHVVRGTFSPSSFSLTVAQLIRIQDNAGQDNFRFAGSIIGITMDDWWASAGADLISASAAQRP